jgi:hypothetical protein
VIFFLPFHYSKYIAYSFKLKQCNNTMTSTTMIILLFTVLFAVTIGSMEAYRLDNDAQTNDLDENNELNDPYFIQRLQSLLAAAATNGGGSPKESSSSDHRINTRLAMNRRPGLIRLKKNI